ncbi:MAG: YHS domain-containing protein [Sediminibacterium sp.]
MLTKNFYSILAICLLFSSCQSGTTKTETKPSTDTVAMRPDTTANVLDHLLVDNKKDPACGMPVSAGIGDTSHYKGKVLGFCSKECKETFQKNPVSLLAAAEMKK